MQLNFVLFALSFNVVYTYRKNDTCGCYILGTVASVESESLCDEETLRCRCLPNVIGVNCDRCAKDHYGILNGRGCSRCHCSSTGSVSTQCDLITGSCKCKDGLSGQNCDQCGLNQYTSENVCTNCNCNAIGSNNLQCDRNGQCFCRKNVAGQQCDRCQENTYNLTEGCQPCPSCYNLVQNNNKNFTQNLTRVDLSLRQIEYNLSPILQDFENFVSELKALVSKIEALLKFDDLGIPSNIESLFFNIKEKTSSFEKEVAELLLKIKEFNIDEVDISIGALGIALNEAQILLKLGQKELDAAWTRYEQMESHNQEITDITKSASAVLGTITAKVEELSLNADSIKAVTKDVCTSAELFKSKQKEIQSDSIALSSEVNQAVTGATTMKSYIKKFSSEVTITYSEAQVLSKRTTNTFVPNVTDISDETAIIKFDYHIVDGLIKEIDNTTEDLKDTVQSTNKYLSKVETTQTIFNKEFELLQNHDKDADTAIKDADALFSKAEMDLEQLIEFQNVHQQIQELKKDIPDIESKIKAVQDNAKDVKQIFEEALDIIKTGTRLNEKVELIQNEIRNNASVILTRSSTVDQMFDEQEEVSGRLEKLDEKLKNVKYNLDKLKSVESETQKKVKQIKEYSLIFNAIPLDNESLNVVEEEVKTLESMFSSIDLFEAEKKVLEKEVALIKEILESLPIDDKTLCEAPESEPKLGTTSTRK